MEQQIMVECPHCGYKWQPRVANPKYCPMCKRPIEKVSSAKQVIETKIAKHRPTAITRCEYYPECPYPAMFETPDGRAYCKQHYIADYVEPMNQPTDEELIHPNVS